MDNRSTNMTGMSGSSKNDYSNYYSKVVEGSKKDNGDSIEITYTNINNDSTSGRYYTENGKKASTTGTIYGIYDMSGGLWEYMANYLGSATGNSYVNSFLKLNEKYQTSYAGDGKTSSTEDRTTNYKANQGKYGDAILETSNGCNGQFSWNQDYSYFPCTVGPFFLRGGNYNGSTGAGLFYFDGTGGGGNNNVSFRVVLF